MMPLHFIESDPNLEAFYCSEKRSVPQFCQAQYVRYSELTRDGHTIFGRFWGAPRLDNRHTDNRHTPTPRSELIILFDHLHRDWNAGSKDSRAWGGCPKMRDVTKNSIWDHDWMFHYFSHFFLDKPAGSFQLPSPKKVRWQISHGQL